MDVGCWLLRTTSANLLKNCVHPVWGLIYSNGTSVYLMPISSINDHTYLHPKLLKLDNVGLIHDISCSPPYQNLHYVAVINSHETGLKLCVFEAAEEDLNKVFSNPTEANLHGNPLPQGLGLAWHPRENVICAVCQNEGFIFKNDVQNKTLEKIRSFSGSEKFTTCCWNYSGSLLIFATQSKLLFYNFSYDSSDLNEPVFNFVIGRVCSLETVDQSRLLCTLELPLHDVIRHRTESSSHEAPSASPMEHLTNVKASSDAIVASSQLLLIGYSSVDGKPHIMARADIQEILTPNIMVYEDTNALCIVASSSSTKLQFFTIDKMNIAKTAEMVLEKGKVPKGVVISAFNNTKLLWLLSGQSCQDCAASLAVPDKEYISCNMTFRVIALKSLLGPEQRFVVQEKDFSGCVDRCKSAAKTHGQSAAQSQAATPAASSSPHIKFTESTSSVKYTAVESKPRKTATADSKKAADADAMPSSSSAAATAPSASHGGAEGDDKSVLSYYSAQSPVSSKKTAELAASSSNEDYYSIGPVSTVSKNCTHHCHPDKKLFDIEKYITEMSRRHSLELSEIKSELQEIKRLISSLSFKPPSSLPKCAPTTAQILCHIQDLQQSMNMVENKVDNLSMEINTKLKHQDRKLSDIRKELSSLISNHT